MGFGGRGGAEELLERAKRSGLPLHSRRRSDDECDVSKGGSGEQDLSFPPPSTPLSSRTLLLRFRFPLGSGLRRPLLVMGGTFREWEKDRSECDVLGLGVDSTGCSFNVIVER